MYNKNNKIEKKEDLKKRICEDDEKKHEVGEDSTKYGEFISSYFAWISLPNQKKRAKELDNMTKRKKDEIKRKNEE